jgi:hypothetical protein
MKTIYSAALGLSGLNPDGKVTRAEYILTTMQSSGNFPAGSMPITYVMLGKLITNLHNAIIAAAGGAPGSASQMHEQERLLVSACNFVRAFVEQTANASVNPTAIIQSAGMTVFTSSGNTAVTELSLTAMGNGTIQICVPRGTGEAAFSFYSSTDGITWAEFALSKLATVELANQTPGTTLYFRYAAIGKSKGAFSQSKSVIVV